MAVKNLKLKPSDSSVTAQTATDENGKAQITQQMEGPPGMVWIEPGKFTMGTDDPMSFPNERPVRRVRVVGFWMDIYEVTNAKFRRFVEATGYVTTAERVPDWEEIKKQVPPGTPKPDESMLVPGSLVFTPTSHPVPLHDLSAWWQWTPSACWYQPEGPGSTMDFMTWLATFGSGAAIGIGLMPISPFGIAVPIQQARRRVSTCTIPTH